MARVSEIDRDAGEIVAVEDVLERGPEAKLMDVRMQRRPRVAAEDARQMERRDAYARGDLEKRETLAEVAGHVLAARLRDRAMVLCGPGATSADGRSIAVRAAGEEAHHRLLHEEPVRLRRALDVLDDPSLQQVRRCVDRPMRGGEGAVETIDDGRIARLERAGDDESREGKPFALVTTLAQRPTTVFLPAVVEHHPGRVGDDRGASGVLNDNAGAREDEEESADRPRVLEGTLPGVTPEARHAQTGGRIVVNALRRYAAPFDRHAGSVARRRRKPGRHASRIASG